MHFLFIYGSPGILGGIETLIARMSQWLVNKGHRVTLLVESSENWADLLPKQVCCIALGDRFPELDYYFHAKRLLKSLKISKPDVIKSFDIRSSWIASQIASATGNRCKVIAGIYNPHVFKHYYATKSLPFWHAANLYVRNFLESIPAKSRVFCDLEEIDELEAIHHQSGMIWPLPIDMKQFLPASRRPKWGKIVSVGRLSPMKEYNLYMIDTVNELIKRGHEVSWSVYGRGQYEAAMRARIKELNLERAISLEGTVSYNHLWKALEDAYIFVGMGTTILEAALFKVPNVLAIGYDREGLTYGPIYRLPVGSAGHVRATAPKLKVADEIERILKLSPSEYDAEQALVYKHAQNYEVEISMKRFLELVDESAPIKPRHFMYLANYPYWFVRRLAKIFTNSRGFGDIPR
jgi:glycosyltransferase involved in cell wall biosynthesis